MIVEINDYTSNIMHALCMIVSADSNNDDNNITKFVVFGSVGGAGLAMGAIIVCLLLAVYRMTQCYCSKRRDLVGNKVENNAAYETVDFQKNIL